MSTIKKKNKLNAHKHIVSGVYKNRDGNVKFFVKKWKFEKKNSKS